MNERIKELAEQAGMKPCADMSKFGMNEDMNPYNCQEFMLEKFAELIVEDVLQLIATSDAKCRNEWDLTERDLYAEIQKHFGVK